MKLIKLTILFDKNFINSIINVDSYLYNENIELKSTLDIKNDVANLYLENCFIEYGLIFDRNVYNEVESTNNLKLI